MPDVRRAYGCKLTELVPLLQKIFRLIVSECQTVLLQIGQ